jgi:hypothetical protein
VLGVVSRPPRDDEAFRILDASRHGLKLQTLEKGGGLLAIPFLRILRVDHEHRNTMSIDM